ncbi:MAG: RNA-guided endonuclease InsQ/TnpB family protein [Candidatus Methanospirareceae archaeon]
MKVQRVVPVRLKPSGEQEEKIEELFDEYKRLISFLVEFCKRTGIIDYREVQRIVYDFCRESYRLPSEVIIQGMRLVVQTFKGSYKARHIPNIDANNFPVRLTHGKNHLFYFVFDEGLKVRISLPNGNGFRKEEILIHRGELGGKLSELTKYEVSDSLLFPDYRLLITLTKEAKMDYEPESAIGVDIGVTNLVTAYCDGGVLQISGKPVLEAHKRGVEHRRMKQKLGSRKFTYNDSKFVKDYVYHAANEVIKFTKRFEKPVIVLEDLKGLKRKLKRLPHVYSIAPYELIHSAIYEKALWEGIRVQTVRKETRYSSQKCPKCGYIDSRNRKGERFKCLKCAYEGDADIIAGMNLSFSAIPPQAKACGTLAER